MICNVVSVGFFQCCNLSADAPFPFVSLTLLSIYILQPYKVNRLSYKVNRLSAAALIHSAIVSVNRLLFISFIS